MRLYRVVSKVLAAPSLSGEGSARFGGRWNPKGVGTVYADLGRQAALGEIFVHVLLGEPRQRWSESLVLVELELPDLISRASIDKSALPKGWTETDYTLTQSIGLEWLRENRTCLLFVPSAHSRSETICLLNPSHGEFPSIRITKTEPLAFGTLSSPYSPATGPSPIRDVFICHASEDKENVVEPLVSAFEASGISFWYDQRETRWGDSVTGAVNQGLKEARFVIVVLSRAFISKQWPQREWRAALNREIALGRTLVLPLLVGTPEERREIVEATILQNDKMYLVWNGDAQSVVSALVEVLTRSE